MDLRIAYEDEHLLVVDKPAGLVVHPAPGTRRARSCTGLLEHDIAGGDAERPGIVHRLDRDTSGLHGRRADRRRRTPVCRTSSAAARSSGSTSRSSAARPRSRSGRIEAPIGRDRRDPLRQSLDTDTPREAVTHFEVVERLWASTRSSRAGWRPAAPTRSACTWRRSGCPSPATRSTDGRASSASSASSSMQRGSPSPIRSRASRWTSSRRCRPICERPWSSARREQSAARMRPFFAPDPADQSGRRCRRSTDAGSVRAPPAAIKSTRKGT